MRLRGTLQQILLWAFFIPVITAFSFTAPQATSCGNLTLTWTGGQAPYYILVLPLFNTPTNISVPVTSNGSYTFQVQLPPTNSSNLGQTQFMLGMGDATGAFSGGITELRNIGPASDGVSCNTSGPGQQWTFALPDALEQCRNYTFVLGDSYGVVPGKILPVRPVTIFAIVPSGTAEGFISTTFTYSDWRADIMAGTEAAFMATDATGLSGGLSTVYTVNPGARDTSCFNSLSPKQTAVPPTPNSGGSGGGLPVGAVAGIAVGATVVLIAFIITVFIVVRRRREHAREIERYLEPIEPDHGNHGTPTRTSATPFPLQRPSVLPTMSERTDGSASGHKGLYSISNASGSNVIVHVHTDLEDQAPSVVHELPPQYADRRDSFASGSGSSNLTTPPLDSIQARTSTLGEEFNPYGNTLTVHSAPLGDKKR